ncbi:phenylalanine--tRNA ligase subunit beta, partial [uncultured Phascolarctobacterium sp.]|uniref:phenylalanine--tRNA ligase subunit beta n=1 Tax=uncultured Phascolarctobacterium sp. TaxID=512296 RepID=UPI0025D08865
MLASLEWLKQYVDINISTAELCDKITRVGLEVDSVMQLGEGLEGVVTGKVMEISRHPNSDHLWVCMMDYGQGGEPVQILTGAQNVKQYDIVPVAVVGSVLPPSGRNPEGMKLKKAKMRGLDSFGMLCSADELGIDSKLLLPEQRNGIFILPPDTPIGVDIKTVLGLDDTVIDIDLTSNRADCFSILGLAREISAITGCPLKMPAMEVAEAAGEKASDYVHIKIAAPELCSRFSTRVLKDIKIAPSPEWMQNRLRACGVRPISNVVDVTNYVMLELGQPMHAYDADKVAGRTLIVRRAEEGEKLITLDDKERILNPSMITIGDAEKAAGLGGVMGGLLTEVTDATKNVILEAASFHGPSIRRTSRALGLRSEASGRFERGVDTMLTHNALNRAAHLLEQMGACETFCGIVEDYPEPVKPAVITTTPEKINGCIGCVISREEIVAILQKLGFGVEEKGAELVITAPSWRRDIECDADISEEIARMHGYDYIESHQPELKITQGHQSVLDDVKDAVQDYMAAAGLNEMMTYSFIKATAFDKMLLPADDSRRSCIELLNPITDAFSVMRTTMIPSALQTASFNLRNHNDSVALFEVGRIFLPKALPLTEDAEERPVLTAVISGKREPLNWCAAKENVDFYDMKGLVEGLLASLQVQDYTLARSAAPYLHPGKSCDIVLNGKVIGSFGEVHPTAQENFELDQTTYVLEMAVEPLVA